MTLTPLEPDEATQQGAAAQALMTKSLSESLNAGSPSFPFGAAAFASSRIAIKRPTAISDVK